MDLSEWIESNRSMFVELSNEVWGYAELGYKEFESSKTLVDAFEEAGFTLEKGVADIPTAFVASYGNGDGPVIGILGEFDALPGLSQDCVPYRKPLKNGAPGHGCGHNLLGVAGLASVMAIK
jgi:aminobenzoyl-glutamate utilization protein B